MRSSFVTLTAVSVLAAAPIVGAEERVVWPSEIECPKGTTPTAAKAALGKGDGGSAPRGDIIEFTCRTPAGKKEGPFLSRTPDGKTLASGRFADGKADGLWVFYAPDGSKVAQVTFERDVPRERTLYFEGTTKVRVHMVTDASGASHETSYYESGKKKTELTVSKSGSVGRMTMWYENGKKSAEGDALGMVRRGEWRDWDERGELLARRTYGEHGEVLSCEGKDCGQAAAQ